MADPFRAHLGETPLSEEERHALIPSLSTQRELNEFEFSNILSARDWALQPRRLARAAILNASYLLELHRRMFNSTWRWAGKIRATEKTIGVAPPRIAIDLAALLGDVQYWMDHHVYSSDEIAVRYHHRLVVIHLFSNGNGRHARLVADIAAAKMGQPILPWGAGTGHAAAVRQAYFAALRTADQHDYSALLSFARSGHY